MSQAIHRRAFFGVATSTAFALGAPKALAANQAGMSGADPAAQKVHMRHAVLIGARVGRVYDAIATAEGLSAWWTPGVTARPERASIARIPFGPDYFKEMRITQLEPSRRVQWLCITGVDEWVGTTISFDLQPGNRETMLESHPELADQIGQQSNRETQTLVTLSHDDWRGLTPMFAECNYTWGQFLRSLKSLCETGRGRPWPQQHRAVG